MVWRAAAATALSVVLSAQDVQFDHVDADGGAGVRVEAFVSAGSARGFGLGWLRVEVQGSDARGHDVSIRVESPRSSERDQLVRRTLRVEAGAATRCFLPLPVSPESAVVSVVVDGAEYVESIHSRRARGHVGLLITDVAGAGPPAASVLAAMPVEAPGRPPQIVAAGSDGVPADWRLYTTFSDY